MLGECQPAVVPSTRRPNRMGNHQGKTQTNHEISAYRSLVPWWLVIQLFDVPSSSVRQSAFALRKDVCGEGWQNSDR